MLLNILHRFSFAAYPARSTAKFLYAVRFASLLHNPIKIIKLSQESEIKNSVQKNGFCVLGMDDIDTSTFKKVANNFGSIQHNNNTDVDGVAEIIGENSKLSTNSAVVSNIKFNAHTDGIYLHGIARGQNDTYYKVTPPKLVLLQCVQSADGGENYLVDGKFILEDLLRHDNWVAKILFNSTAMSISHRDQLVTDIAVFNQVKTNLFTLRYSFDKSLYFPLEFQYAHETFNKSYIENEKYISYFKLSPGQVLLIDNRRMLHGRLSFTGARHFRRIWVQDDQLSQPIVNAALTSEENYVSKKNFIPSFERFDKYKTPIPIKKVSFLSNMDLGISLCEAALKVYKKLSLQ